MSLEWTRLPTTSISGTSGVGGGPSASVANTINTDIGKIFVGGLSWQTTEESLRFHFEQYGAVLSVEVMRNRQTGEPRGFAFVVFQDQNTVDLVMSEDKHEINHKVVDVKRAQARGIAPPSIHEGGVGPIAAGAAIGGIAPPNLVGQQPHQLQQQQLPQLPTQQQHHHSHHQSHLSPEQLQCKVFVGGIPPQVDRDELRALFEQFGPVVDAAVMLDQITQRSRGFGFVTFESGSTGAQQAIAAQPIPLHGRSVEVKLATPRPESATAPVTGATNSNSNTLPSGHYGNSTMKSAFTLKRGGATAAASGGDPLSVAPSKHVGLRAGLLSGTTSTGTGPYAGLSVAYGRNGWKAGYGSKAFGPSGWAVQGWEELAPITTSGLPLTVTPLERSGFSFALLLPPSAQDIPITSASSTSMNKTSGNHKTNEKDDGISNDTNDDEPPLKKIRPPQPEQDEIEMESLL